MLSKVKKLTPLNLVTPANDIKYGLRQKLSAADFHGRTQINALIISNVFDKIRP